VSDLLPLFPLEMVLFPGEPVPLHIFEPRYKEMIGECLSAKAPFGIVRVQDSALAEVGCAAEIVRLLKKYEDGRMNILTQGGRRFEVLELDQERSFLRGRVSYFDDDDGQPSPEQRRRAVELHSQLLAVTETEAEIPEADAEQLSFRLAASLPVDLDFKQALLAMRTETERITTLTEYYTKALPKLRRLMHTRRKAGGNGHV